MKNLNKIIKKNKLHLIKKLGQNFLINNNIINKIIEISNFEKEDFIIEIGSGIGNLTDKLLNKAKKVITIEIDKKLIPILKKQLNCHQNLKIINDDFLKLNLKKLVNEEFVIKKKSM